VVDIESLPGEGLEIRMMVKLRVQNPNDTPLEYHGAYLQLDVLDNTFATGVSDERGTIGPFSEALIQVPVSASALRMAFSAYNALTQRQARGEGELPDAREAFGPDVRLDRPSSRRGSSRCQVPDLPDVESEP
jgi:hypothetical protein